MKRMLLVTLLLPLFLCTIATAGENLLSTPAIGKDTGWIIWMSDKMSGAGAKADFKDGAAVFTIPSQDKPTPSELQLVKPINIDADKSYTLKFKLASEGAGSLVIGYGMRTGARTTYAAAKVAVTPGEKTYEVTLQVKKGTDGKYESPRVLRIHMGGIPGSTVTMSEVTLEAK